MDTRTGEIGDRESMKEKMGREAFDEYAKVPIHNLSLVRQQTLNEFGRADVGRNGICPCGSGKIFKKCCLARGWA